MTPPGDRAAVPRPAARPFVGWDRPAGFGRTRVAIRLGLSLSACVSGPPAARRASPLRRAHMRPGACRLRRVPADTASPAGVPAGDLRTRSLTRCRSAARVKRSSTPPPGCGGDARC